MAHYDTDTDVSEDEYGNPIVKVTRSTRESLANLTNLIAETTAKIEKLQSHGGDQDGSVTSDHPEGRRPSRRQPRCRRCRSPTHATTNCPSRQFHGREAAVLGSAAPAGRPQVTLKLGKKHELRALVDTGATRSLLRRDMAVKVLNQNGRPAVFKRCTDTLTSLTGQNITVIGQVELVVQPVGPVNFIVVKDMSQEALLGIDQLRRYDYNLDSRTLQWGRGTFWLAGATGPEVSVQEIGEVGAPAVDQVVRQYNHLFGEEGRLPASDLPALEIETEPGKVVNQKMYRTTLSKRHVIDEEIDKMLELGVIRPSNSEWASPVTLVPKKDGTTRFCVDYRRLNSITVKDRYPLPLIQDVFDTLEGAKVFSTLDLTSGYWQLPVHDASIKKTAFVCHRGLFEFVRMPFGLCNAPSFFQRAMTKVLSQFIGKFCMPFLDDIVIFSKNEEEHAKHLAQVFEAMSAAGLTLKAKKCHFLREKLDLLGFVVSKDGVSAQPEKVAAIASMPAPTDVSGVRSFLGMTGYYRSLVRGYAELAEPLHALTRTRRAWKWGLEENRAFDALKNALTTSPVLAYPKTDQGYILYTDACDYAVGAILCQDDENGLERPLHYLSHQLNETQRRWATIEKEAYAVVYALKKLRPYLLGSEFVVYTDHKPLLSFFLGEVANTKVQRWAVLLAEFGARIRYRPGKANYKADMLSRIRNENAVSGSQDVDVGTALCSLEIASLLTGPEPERICILDADAEWVSARRGDLEEVPVLPLRADDLDLEEVRRAQQLEYPEEIRDSQDEESRYLILEGLLYSRARPRRDAAECPRLVLPAQMQERVIRRCHEEVGHQSVLKTLVHAQEHYVWPGMKRTVEEQLQKCGKCIVHNKPKERLPMGEMPVATRHGQFMSIDLIGPLIPSAPRENRYILTCIDHYSGWAECYPLKTKSNEAVWERLRNDYMPRHGFPNVLLTDQGSEFKGTSFREWLHENGVEHRRTSPYHPQSNGRIERFNRTLKSMLKKLINGQRAMWEEQLSVALTAYRISTSVVTGFSPFMLLYLQPPRIALSRTLDRPRHWDLHQRLSTQADVLKAAAEATRASRQHNRDRLARQANAAQLNVGDRVILRAREPLSLTAKWDPGYTVNRINGKVITITHHTTGARQIVNRDQIRLVDPDVAWEEVAPRPKRQQARPRLPVEARLRAAAEPEDQDDEPVGRERERPRPARRDDPVEQERPAAAPEGGPAAGDATAPEGGPAAGDAAAPEGGPAAGDAAAPEGGPAAGDAAAPEGGPAAEAPAGPMDVAPPRGEPMEDPMDGGPNDPPGPARPEVPMEGPAPAKAGPAPTLDRGAIREGLRRLDRYSTSDAAAADPRCGGPARRRRSAG